MPDTVQISPRTRQSSLRRVTVNSLDSDLSRTHILFGKTHRHYAEWSGHLSLKTFRNGTALYDAGLGRYAVKENECLILNEAQPYSITIDTETQTESLCVFFESGFADEVNRSHTTSTIDLLDEPEKPVSNKLAFIQKLYSREDLNLSLANLRSAIETDPDDELALSESLHGIMDILLQKRFRTVREIARIPAVRPSTREELYKRVCRARDFIAAAYREPVLIQDISRIACLSPNHFLRSFKQVFSITPHQYLTKIRLERAKKLLAETDRSIISICHSVGFESHSSFSLLFRRHFGTTPELFRRQNGVFQ